MPIIAKSETKNSGFSTKSVIIFSSFTLTTPKDDGSSILFTQIMPSLFFSNLKSALNNVSAKATTTLPLSDSLAHKMACAVPSGWSW